MDFSGSDLVYRPFSTQSINDLSIAVPRPTMGHHFMSAPDVRKRFRALHLQSIKRRKVSQDFTVDQVVTVTSSMHSALGDVKHQATVTVTPRTPSPDELYPRRRFISQWLSQQAERFKKDRHRGDSLLSSEELEKELKLLSLKANATIQGPHGELVPQRVIDHFFDLYPACGSGWRNSERWEQHRRKCSQLECNICKDLRSAPRRVTEPIPCPPASPLSVSLQPSSPQKTESPNGRQGLKEAHWWDPFLRSKSSERRRKHGKAPALDKLHDTVGGSIDEGPVSPRMQVPESRPKSRETRPQLAELSADSYDKAFWRQSRKPVRCSFVARTFNPAMVPVPAVSRKPESSKDFDARILAHQTGRPRRANTLDLIDFPLADSYKAHYNSPPAPSIKPERRIELVPEPLRLDEPSRDDSMMFNMSFLPSAGPSATNIHRGFYPASRHRDADTVTSDDPYSIEEVLAQYADGIEMRKTRNNTRSQTIRMVPSPAPSPKPTMPIHFPPTPPHSRENSYSRACSPAEKTHASVLPPIKHFFAEEQKTKAPPPVWSSRVPDEPADRDWDKCVVSDTTGASLPDCPVYVDPREANRRWWKSRHGREHRGRYAPGISIFR